jgi:hypothetical protein
MFFKSLLWIRKVLDLMDQDPSLFVRIWIRIWILSSSSKKSKKNLDIYCDIDIFMIFLSVGILKAIDEGAGSGSVSQ